MSCITCSKCACSGGACKLPVTVRTQHINVGKMHIFKCTMELHVCIYTHIYYKKHVLLKLYIKSFLQESIDERNEKCRLLVEGGSANDSQIVICLLSIRLKCT